MVKNVDILQKIAKIDNNGVQGKILWQQDVDLGILQECINEGIPKGDLGEIWCDIPLRTDFEAKMMDLAGKVVRVTISELPQDQKESVSQQSDTDEPDLKPISNCLKKKIEITPEICKKFWEYRADSGHLSHLLYDLLGEKFVTTHRQDESIRKVLEGWESRDQLLDKVVDIANMRTRFDRSSLGTITTGAFLKDIESLRQGGKS